MVSDVKKEVLGKAVLLVLGDRARFRRIRVGGGKGSFHLTEEEGGAREISPLDLPFTADPGAVEEAHRRFAESPYLYWFRREVQKAAMAIILDEPYPPSTSGTEGVGDKRAASSVPLDEETVADIRIDGDPHLQALSMEGYDEAAMRLGPLLEQASPRQRDLLILLSDGASTAEAARALGIAESTARVHLKRFRDKISAV
ncbi:MAG: helix-turn-helix domain-containing protein [Chloroflexia bacterium]|nr:helix-turn-helix domain-containing protein [Chloroflexia bacterium]